jgi:hypothetical protein
MNVDAQMVNVMKDIDHADDQFGDGIGVHGKDIS